MNSLCNHCGICCKLIPIDLEQKILIRDNIQNLDEKFLELLSPLQLDDAKLIDKNYVNNILSIFPNVKFFYCKLLSKDNLCTSIDKHEFCKTFPSDAMAIIPDECGYYGEIFIKNEEVKQKIRKYKEEIIYYKSMINSGCKEEKVYTKIIESLERFIIKYQQFGSNNW